MTATPLPMHIIFDSLEVSKDSTSGLKWKPRPRSHFNTQRGHRIFNSAYAGKDAGYPQTHPCGKRFMVKIGLLKFPASRIVFAINSGADPWPNEVDHIDGNTENNSPENLRVATRSENASNKSVSSTNTSGVIGVTRCKRTNKWMAQIGKDKRTMFLGRFDSIDDATKARRNAEDEMHGEFSGSFSRRKNSA